jgi:hypothetical protein
MKDGSEAVSEVVPANALVDFKTNQSWPGVTPDNHVWVNRLRSIPGNRREKIVVGLIQGDDPPLLRLFDENGVEMYRLNLANQNFQNNDPGTDGAVGLAFDRESHTYCYGGDRRLLEAGLTYSLRWRVRAGLGQRRSSEERSKS